MYKYSFNMHDNTIWIADGMDAVDFKCALGSNSRRS